jgi:hypothetical protein
MVWTLCSKLVYYAASKSTNQIGNLPPGMHISVCHPIASSHDRESVRESNLEAIADAHMPSSHVDKNARDKEGA